MAGGQGKLQQLLINMHALSFFFPSVEEEDEDEEMAEVKPGLESEQPDEDDSRETKEGAIPGRVDGSALFPPLSSSPGVFHAVGQTRSLVCDTTSRLQPYQMEGPWGGRGHCGSIVSAIGHVGVGVD